MPVQKRSSKNLEEDSHQQQRYRHYQQQQKLHEDEDGDDSDRTLSSSSGESGDKDEFLLVKLSEVRKEVQCPICLGIIRKTRTVMECLHRFCRECIDKSMRLGNNECPACRTHCASRRSLRDDPNYDTIIATLYPDIDKYEEKELAFCDEEKTRNKLIQESIAQTFQRQSEALGRRRTTAKSVTSFTRNNRRGRNRNNQATRIQSSHEYGDGSGSNSNSNGNGNGNGGVRDSSSSDEQSTDVKQKRYGRWAGRCSVQPSSASVNPNVGYNNESNGSEVVNKESTDPSSPGFFRTPEVLVWGKGGTRSQSRQRSANGSNARSNGLV